MDLEPRRRALNRSRPTPPSTTSTATATWSPRSSAWSASASSATPTRAPNKLAEETGVAFQLTNILRDVKEDVERGRVYLPIDLLDEFGETSDELRELAAGRAMTERERAMLATLAIRAEKYYVAANKLIPLLDRDSRAAMWVLVTIYHRLLGRIADRKMEVFRERISLSTARKTRSPRPRRGDGRVEPGG